MSWRSKPPSSRPQSVPLPVSNRSGQTCSTTSNRNSSWMVNTNHPPAITSPRKEAHMPLIHRGISRMTRAFRPKRRRRATPTRGHGKVNCTHRRIRPTPALVKALKRTCLDRRLLLPNLCGEENTWGSRVGKLWWGLDHPCWQRGVVMVLSRKVVTERWGWDGWALDTLDR